MRYTVQVTLQMEDGPFSKWCWENWLSIWGKKWGRVPSSHYSQKLTLCLLEGHSISDQKPRKELSIGVDCPASLPQDSLTHPASSNQPASGMTAGRFPPQLHSKWLKVKPDYLAAVSARSAWSCLMEPRAFRPWSSSSLYLNFFGTNTY